VYEGTWGTTCLRLLCLPWSIARVIRRSSGRSIRREATRVYYKPLSQSNYHVGQFFNDRRRSIVVLHPHHFPSYVTTSSTSKTVFRAKCARAQVFWERFQEIPQEAFQSWLRTAARATGTAGNKEEAGCRLQPERLQSPGTPAMKQGLRMV
jgi:hypothetical protein